MHYAINVPNFGAEARYIADLAHDAKEAGWDGFFIWDHIQGDAQWRLSMCDPWVALTAAAMQTSRIRLGTMVTPLPRRRPWVLARQTATLDRLSNGRLILGVGLGYPPDAEYEAFGEDGSDRVRAEKLDEALGVLVGLWSGEPFSYIGKHYTVRDVVFQPTPVQRPRIPIWCAGMWPARPPFRRAAQWDGVVPIRPVDDGLPYLGPDHLREVLAYTMPHRTINDPFEVTVSGETPSERDSANDIVAPYAAAGATWWMEDISAFRATAGELRARVRAGPPTI